MSNQLFNCVFVVGVDFKSKLVELQCKHKMTRSDEVILKKQKIKGKTY